MNHNQQPKIWWLNFPKKIHVRDRESKHLQDTKKQLNREREREIGRGKFELLPSQVATLFRLGHPG